MMIHCRFPCVSPTEISCSLFTFDFVEHRKTSIDISSVFIFKVLVKATASLSEGSPTALNFKSNNMAQKKNPI